MLGGADTSTPCVDQAPGAGVYFGAGFLGVSFTSRMPVIFSFDFSCAHPRLGKVSAPAATAAAPVRKFRRFMSSRVMTSPPCAVLRLEGSLASLFRGC